jgi:hypothetical protein
MFIVEATGLVKKGAPFCKEFGFNQIFQKNKKDLPSSVCGFA